MGTKIYDPKSVIVAFGPNILTGFGESVIITVARDEDTFTKKTGVDGETTRTRNMNRGGTFTLQLHQSSASNLVLSALAVADELAPNGASILPFTVKDNAGNSLFFARAAWVKKPPDSEWGKESGDREWVFDTGKVNMLEGGN